MYPNCSQYGLLAIEKHGIFWGSLMIFDRLHRCGHDLKNYEKIEIDKHIKFTDLVPE
jgi:putative component of membrane protein insertase Oxa1/YidC/SpoIIIJ protein YidD